MLARAPERLPTRLPPQPIAGGQLPPFAACAGTALIEQVGLGRQPSAREELGTDGKEYGASRNGRDGDGANEVTLEADDFELSSEVLGYYAIATGMAPLLGAL